MKIMGFAGWSGSGKTTLIEKVIQALRARGLVVSLIKHGHHNAEFDVPGKDSYRHRQAGCQEVLMSSGRRWALIHELRGAPEPRVEDLIARLSPCDVVLVEGYKNAPFPKVEVHRPSVGKPLIYPGNSHVVAIATDVPVEAPMPRFDINDPAAVAEFVIEYLDLQSSGDSRPSGERS